MGALALDFEIDGNMVRYLSSTLWKKENTRIGDSVYWNRNIYEVIAIGSYDVLVVLKSGANEYTRTTKHTGTSGDGRHFVAEYYELEHWARYYEARGLWDGKKSLQLQYREYLERQAVNA